jgi:hypothetical protein
MELLREYQFRVEHDHGGGSWGLMDEDREHHGAAATDPERGWIQRVFRCDSCNELVRVRSRQPETPGAIREEGAST